MKQLFAAAMLCLWLSGLSPLSAVSAQEEDQITVVDGPEVIYIAAEGPSTLRVPAPELGPGLNAANVQITFHTAGSSNHFGYSCLAYPAQAQAAFQYAVNIWASYLNSTVPIQITACWTALGSNVLGSAGAYRTPDSFPNRPYAGYSYPLALANALAGSDVAANYPDIVTQFNSDFSDWYYGTDGNPSTSQWDFVSVVLHEITHGLGMNGSMSVRSGALTYASPPYIYDRYTENSGGTALLSLPNGGAELAAALTSAVYFDGPNANAGNGGARVALYAPSSWAGGSSYSHLAESFNGSANALMTYALYNGESVHSPGPVVLGILADIGWPVAVPPAAPSGLSAAAASTSQINLSWSDGSSNETGFEVYRSTDAGAWTLIASLAANTTGYAGSGLASGTRYYFRVRAVNAGGASGYSNTASAVTSGAPPAPSGLSAMGSGETSILLRWNDNSNVETGFEIQRYNSQTSQWGSIATVGANVTSYTNSGLTKSTSYQYRVRALYTTNSDFSSSAAATTWSVTYRNFLPLIGR